MVKVTLKVDEEVIYTYTSNNYNYKIDYRLEAFMMFCIDHPTRAAQLLIECTKVSTSIERI